MKRHTFCMIIVAVTVLTGAAWAEQAQKEEQLLRLELDLTDGSRVVGVPGIESVSVQTPYAKMDLPLKQIRTLKIGKDRETVSFDLRNGDKLTGVLTLGSVKLETVFGKATLGIEHLRGLRVLLEGGALPEALRKELVSYYSFDRDEGGRVTDGSGKQNDARIHGAKWTAKGKSGGAYEFDGVNDYLDAGNPPSLQLTANFTLAAWIWPERTKDSFGIITKTQAYPTQERRAIEFLLGHDDTLSAYFWDESTRYFSGVVKNNNIRRQEWSHVVLIHDPSLPEHQMRAYINGVSCEMTYGYETVASIPVVRNVSEPVRIGCMRPGVHPFKGRMDEVMIFNRALTDEEVKTVYDSKSK